MFMAVRWAKWRIDSFSRAGQLASMQRATTSPASRTTGEPQAGHSAGRTNGRRSAPSAATRTTLGITSPLRSTTTRSPICRPSRAISSSLWRVARDTVTPPTSTGRSRARGVTAPVRPTWTSMSSTTVSACCAAGLQATAHRGDFDVAPSRRQRAVSSSLNTTPSMS